MDEFRICVKCEIHHYEDCPNCFGFGVFKSKYGAIIPIEASVAHDFNREVINNSLPCPVCGSTIKGLPQ